MEDKKNLDILLNSNIGQKFSYTDETLDKSFAKLDCEECNPNNEKDTILKDNGWSEFRQKDLEDFIDNFTTYADENTSNKIDWEKFDYNIYNEAYFAESIQDSTVQSIKY